MLSFPLSLAQFADLLEIQTGDFHLSDARAFDLDGAGQIIDAKLGTNLWLGSATLIPKSHEDQSSIEAMIDLLHTPGSSFFLYNRLKQYPISDPTGSILGASTPTISTFNANNVDLIMSGLPPGYVITCGDMFGFTYTVLSVTRYALHRVTVGGTASGGGVTGTMQVTPPVRPGRVNGVAVSLIRPVMKTKILPGSYKPSTGAPGSKSSGPSFNFTQTLGR